MTNSCWLGIDVGHQELGDAEHAALALADALGCPDEVCTHALALPVPHYAASLRIPAGSWAPAGIEGLRALGEGAIVFDGCDWAFEVGDVHARVGARAAVAAHASGMGGRAVRFVGQSELRGAMTVEAMIAASAIEVVQVLGAALIPGSVVETRDYLRPRYSAGALTLVVTPGGDGRLQTFEIEHAHQCCGGH